MPFSVEPNPHGGGYLGFDTYDVLTQRFTSTHVTVTGDGQGKFRSIPFRYVWPSELELMARLAGMRLEHRWSGWEQQPLTADDRSHVSVWQKN